MCALVCECVSEVLTFYAVCLPLQAAAKGYYNFVVLFARHKTRPEAQAQQRLATKDPGLQARQSKEERRGGGAVRVGLVREEG